MIWIVWAIGLICILAIINQVGTSFPIALIVIFALYFLPAIIAAARHHMNAGAILVLNLFLGWTFVGWVMALVWACTNNVEAAHR